MKEDLTFGFIKLTESISAHGLPGELARTSASPAPRAGFTVSPKHSSVSGGPQALFDQGIPLFSRLPGAEWQPVVAGMSVHCVPPASSPYSATVAYLRVG